MQTVTCPVEKRVHVVVDLETLGTSHDAQILQIGAAVIKNGEVIDAFSCNIDLPVKITVDKATLQWWLLQPHFTQVAFAGKRMSLRDALKEFNFFLLQYPDCLLVGNGATFDITILESAYKAEGIDFVCKFKNYRDLRTYLEMFEKFTESTFALSQVNDHVAVDDAIREAHMLIHIFESFNV